MPKVSIVVPVYNVEKYLDRCLSSLLQQTLRDIEIILVDDGSSDNSSEICDQYAKNNNQIKVIHKKNGGLSSARNAGMDVAAGQYIGFVDSDDDVDLTMYEALSNILDSEDVDFVMCDYKRILKNGTSYRHSLNIDSGKYEKKKIISDIYPSLIMGGNIDYGPLLSVWHCLYKRVFLKKNNLFFDEKIRWSEDNIFSAFAGYYAESFYYLKGADLYHYYQNEGTITTTMRKGSWKVYKTMNQLLRQFFESVTSYDFSQQLKWHMIYYACNCIGQTRSMNRKERIHCIQEIVNSDECIQALRNVDTSKVANKLKLQLLLMKIRNVYLLNRMIERGNRNA